MLVVLDSESPEGLELSSDGQKMVKLKLKTSLAWMAECDHLLTTFSTSGMTDFRGFWRTKKTLKQEKIVRNHLF
jgi:hypothetical protein